MKQIFEVPENCNVQIELINNTIVTTFVEREIIFKELDCYLSIDEDGKEHFSICKEQSFCYVVISDGMIYMPQFVDANRTFTKITREEMQSELAKHGKVFDFDNKVLKELRWRAEIANPYFLMNFELITKRRIDEHEDTDNMFFKSGNYFRTEQECQAFCDKVKQILTINKNN
ncbi:hypothetical protein CCP3SC1AL1_1620007 [Gammaproteobacteria bacterium]